jgi:hypothetical protein
MIHVAVYSIFHKQTLTINFTVLERMVCLVF